MPRIKSCLTPFLVWTTIQKCSSTLWDLWSYQQNKILVSWLGLVWAVLQLHWQSMLKTENYGGSAWILFPFDYWSQLGSKLPQEYFRSCLLMPKEGTNPFASIQIWRQSTTLHHLSISSRNVSRIEKYYHLSQGTANDNK